LNRYTEKDWKNLRMRLCQPSLFEHAAEAQARSV